jgi:hypothetical protein
VQARQSPTFGSSAPQQWFFTLETSVQVGACLKDVENTLEMDRDVLHLGHHLRGPQGRPNQVGGPIHVSSSPSRAPRAVCSKTDAHVSYGLRFGLYLYGWNQNFIELPMAPVPPQKIFWVVTNHRNKWTSRICQGVAAIFWIVGPYIVLGSIMDVSSGICFRLIYCWTVVIFDLWNPTLRS